MYQIRIAPVVCLSSLIPLTVKIAFVFDNFEVLPSLIRLIAKQKMNEKASTQPITCLHKFIIIHNNIRYDKCKYASIYECFLFFSICLIWHSTISFIRLVTISKTFSLRFREFHFLSTNWTWLWQTKNCITHIVCWFCSIYFALFMWQ